jgi:hypothetical protein
MKEVTDEKPNVQITLHNRAYNLKGSIAKRISDAGYGVTKLGNGSYTGLIVTGKGLYLYDIVNLLSDYLKRHGSDIKITRTSLQ